MRRLSTQVHEGSLSGDLIHSFEQANASKQLCLYNQPYFQLCVSLCLFRLLFCLLAFPRSKADRLCHIESYDAKKFRKQGL